MTNYYEKYLKYKLKYINIKQKAGSKKTQQEEELDRYVKKLGWT